MTNSLSFSSSENVFISLSFRNGFPACKKILCHFQVIPLVSAEKSADNPMSYCPLLLAAFKTLSFTFDHFNMCLGEGLFALK